MLSSWLISTLKNILFLRVSFIRLAILAAIIMYVIDKTNKKHTIRQGFPVIEKSRWLCEYLGEFFRQYFSTMNRDYLLFKRSRMMNLYYLTEGAKCD
jgi:hypothetical protein